MDFNRYFTNEELEATVKDWAEQYPGLIQVSAIGTSHEGRPLWLLTLTSSTTGADLDKPAVWLDGNIHATELAGTTTTLFLAHYLLDHYGKDPQATRLLDTSVFYVVPRINPDGAAAAMDKNPRFLRSGVRPYPWQELDEGLHVQDVDGDSRILQMRIPDPNGDWKAHPDDPRFMVKRDPAEHGGTYYRLLPEGLVENYDGYLINLARPQAGLDFNRNFPFEWRPENEQMGAGPYPASEPEIGALVKFINQHPNINVALTFHTFGRVLLRPYSTKSDEMMDPSDLWVFKTIGDMGTKASGYRNVSTFHDFIAGPRDITTGAFDDWMYDHFGAFVFTVEQWDLPTEAGVKDRKWVDWWQKHPLEEDQMILKWVDENSPPGGYVDWYAFDHPQLGKVELGGWNSLYTWRNPPNAWMGKEAEKHLPFVLGLGDLLPHLALHTLKVSKAGEGAWAIDLVVENTGYLPTFTSNQARQRKIVRPVIAELSVPEGAKIILGKPRMEVGQLEGRSNKDTIAAIFAASPTDNRARVQWMVEAPEGSVVALVIRSERAGKICKTVELK